MFGGFKGLNNMATASAVRIPYNEEHSGTCPCITADEVPYV